MSEGTAGFRARKLLRGPRGKTEQSRELQADVPALQIELCQILPLSDTTALLRVAGRWSGAAPTDAGLVVGRSMPRAPLAPGATTDADGLWSAGFEVPVGCAGAELALVTAASVTRLPRPANPSETPADVLEELEDSRAQVTQLEARCEVTERELRNFRTKLVDAWAEVSQMREQVKAREDEYEGALRRAGQAVGIVDELRSRAERGEAKLQQARKVAHDAMDVATSAARELLAERARADEATELAELHGEQLARVERELTDSREELESARSRIEELEGQLTACRAEAAEATARIAELQKELAPSSERLARLELELREAHEDGATARSRIEELERECAAGREEVAAATARIAELEGELARAGEQLVSTDDAVEAASAEVTAELADLRERFAKAVARADALETQFSAAREELAKTAAEQPSRGFRSKVSARVHAETLEKLEREVAERERVEAEAAQLGDRVRELENEIESYHAEGTPAAVEDDLRHLLSARQRELNDVRAELQEQRARYAAVASRMTPEELAATAETRPAQDDWTALDDDLLNRLARAKQLSQPD